MINLVSVSLVWSFCFLSHLLFTGDWWSWLLLSGVRNTKPGLRRGQSPAGLQKEISCHLFGFLGLWSLAGFRLSESGAGVSWMGPHQTWGMEILLWDPWEQSKLQESDYLCEIGSL